jgi:hypothetical protein
MLQTCEEVSTCPGQDLESPNIYSHEQSKTPSSSIGPLKNMWRSLTSPIQYLCPLRQVRELSGEVQQPQHRFSGLRRFSATIVKVRESRGRAAAVAPILRSSSWICSKIYAPRHSIDCQFLFYQLLKRKKAIIPPQLSSTSRVARIRSSTAPIRARQKSTICAPPASSLRSRTSSS